MGYMSKESRFDAWLLKNTLFFKTFILVLEGKPPPTQIIVLGKGLLHCIDEHSSIQWHG
jgi:hypothetical protein